MPRQSSDEEIRTGFEELVKPHEDMLFAGALSFTGNRADAEDLLQETFLRAYIGFKRAQDIRKPRAWLFRIMTNAYINRYHKKQRQPTHLAYDDGLDHRIDRVLAPSEDNPQEKFFSRFFDSEIQDALDSLPEQFREAVILCDISDLTYEEISNVLDIPMGTVRSRISRGREMLFGKLENYARERGLLGQEDKGRGK